MARRRGWVEIRDKLTADLAPFHPDPALLDKTVADMKVAAAAFDSGTYQVLASDIETTQSARDRLYGDSPTLGTVPN